MVQRRRVTLSAIGIAALLASSCSGGGSGISSTAGNGGVVKLRLLRFFSDCSQEYKGVTDVSKAVGECGVITVLTNKFNAENHDVQIETQVADQANYYQQLSTQMSSQSPPDIAIMHGAEIPRFASRHTLTPLKDGLTKAGVNLGDLQPSAAQNASYNGTLEALPFDLHTLLTYVNVDLFRKAGMVDSTGKPKLPKSPQEMMSAAKAMKAKTGKQFLTVQSDADIGTDWLMASFVWQQGGDVISKDGKTSSVNTPEMTKAVSLMKGLASGGYYDPNIKDTNAAFLGGDVAMIVNGTWAVDQFYTAVKGGQAAFKHLAVLPLLNVYGTPAQWANSHTWVIPASKDTRKLAAKMKVLKFLFDNNAAWARTGHFPARTSVLTDPSYLKLPLRSEYVNAATATRIFPRAEQIDAFEAVLREQLLAAYLGQKSIPSVLKDAQSGAQGALTSSG
jgi:multiple sugar transport system substrate-binding protein